MTYWMNRLQHLPGAPPLFVTLTAKVSASPAIDGGDAPNVLMTGGGVGMLTDAGALDSVPVWLVQAARNAATPAKAETAPPSWS